MNHDEPHFEKKLHKFSVAKQCPKCGKLSLAFRHGSLRCTNCGYEESIPAIES